MTACKDFYCPPSGDRLVCRVCGYRRGWRGPCQGPRHGAGAPPPDAIERARAWLADPWNRADSAAATVVRDLVEILTGERP